MSLKQAALKFAIVAALTGSMSAAFAGTVGGSVTAINSFTTNDVSNITIGTSSPGANGQTDTTIVSGTIDNNDEFGWKMTVTSANVGKLTRNGGAGGAGRQILYTNIKFVKTGGTLGAGLSDPNGQTKNIVTGASGGGNAGETIFNTGAAVGTHGTATTATEAYAYALRISWTSDTTLLSGTYSDTITVVVANDT